jgi:hypothetical protein
MYVLIGCANVLTLRIVTVRVMSHDREGQIMIMVYLFKNDARTVEMGTWVLWTCEQIVCDRYRDLQPNP